MAVGLLTGAIAGLFVIQMMRSRFIPKNLSAARFFKDLPPPHDHPKWNISVPSPTIPFLWRLVILVLFLSAALSVEPILAVATPKNIGAWIVVDTSASMTTLQNGKPRIRLAQEEARRAIDSVRTTDPAITKCWRVSTFDLAVHDLVPSTVDADSALHGIENISPRHLGTDVNQLRRLAELIGQPSTTECELTHILIITDQPAPEWLGGDDSRSIIWRDIGGIVDNIGVTRVESSRNPLRGAIDQVQVEITAFGNVPGNGQVQITFPNGSVVEKKADWRSDNVWVEKFAPSMPGRYKFTVTPGGNYADDDVIMLDIAEGALIRVDWRASDRTWLALLKGAGNWAEDRNQSHLRVVSSFAELVTDTVPTLVVGNAYPKSKPPLQEILDFYEPSPLLADLNLDVAESIGIQGIDVPNNFLSVLRGKDGKTWLAQRTTPLGAYVPGFPTGSNDNVGRFSTTVFFNALRWLIQARSLPPLYILTTDANPEPEGIRLSLHEGEGDTTRPSQSHGSLDDLQPSVGNARKQPVWPPLVTLAVLLFCIDRIFSVGRGNRWS